MGRKQLLTTSVCLCVLPSSLPPFLPSSLIFVIRVFWGGFGLRIADVAQNFTSSVPSFFFS